MIEIKVNTMIHRPAKQVFDFVSSPKNDFQWQYGTLISTSIPDGANKIGSFFRSIGHMLGQRMQGVFEVTEYEPNQKYGFKSLSGSLHLQTSYTFESVSGSTKISILTQAYAVNSFQINERLMERKMKKQLKENLALLKELLESEQVAFGTAAI